MIFILQIIQIILAVTVTFLVLIQTKGGALSNGLMGSMTFYRSKRGVEKVIFIVTIVLSVILVINSLFIVLNY